MPRQVIASVRYLLVLMLVGALPALAKAPDAGNTLSIPYFAVGGMPEGWHFLTMLSLENGDKSQLSGTVEFLTTDGHPMHIQLDDGAALAAQSEWSIAGGDSKVFVLSHPGNKFEAGWVRVRAARKTELHAIAIIQFYNGDELVGQAGVLPGTREGSAPDREIRLDGNLPSLEMTRPAHNAMTRLFRTSATGNSGALSGHAAPVVVTKNEKGLVETGYASWYGYPYHGRLAASGKIYNQETLTAAHRSLKFGTRAKVTNLRNGRSVVVRIEDRGPFAKNRIVDLSRAAAREIGMLKTGVSPVVLQALPS